jgi:small-conductance mechanosensitive channel
MALMLGIVLGSGAANSAAALSTTAATSDIGNPETVASVPGPVRAAVRFRGQELFEVTMPVGALSIGERAAAIEGRLAEVVRQPPSILGQLRVDEHDGRSELYAGEVLIRVVTDADARGTGRTRRQLAADQLELVRAALQIEYRDRTTAGLLRGAALALGATVLFVGLIFLLRRLYVWTRRRISRAAQAWRWESGLAHLELLSPAAVARASRTFAGALAWLLGALLLYVYLEFVLAQFPWTRGLADRMVAVAGTAVVHTFSRLASYLPELFNIVVIIVVARYLLKAIRAVFQQVALERLKLRGFYAEWAMPTYSIVRFMVIAIAVVMVFPYLPGSGSEGFRGVSVFLGLLVSLGAASAIANVIAGIVITYMRPFRVGDRVKIADAVGDITGKDLFVVRLRTIKNVDITIPNSLVLANHIINYSSSARTTGLILHTSVTIGYATPWQKVHELLLAAAGRVDGLRADPPPFVLQTGLQDFYVCYELNVYTDRPHDMAPLYSSLHREIQTAFHAAGVEILSPHYTAVRDGGGVAIPDAYLPRDYRAPRFGVLTEVLRPQEAPSGKSRGGDGS